MATAMMKSHTLRLPFQNAPMIISFTCVFIPKGSKNVFQLCKSLCAAFNADYSHWFEIGKESEINHRMCIDETMWRKCE
jgi:hypothetical protein